MTNETIIDARERLVRAALEVFAEKGYASASTREICKLAGANVAAIHYYFNDKASLYREIFHSAGEFHQKWPQLENPGLPLPEVLAGFYRHQLEFVNQPRAAQHFRILMVREQLQPTGLLEAGSQGPMAPYHGRLEQMLQHNLGVDVPDLALQQLAFSLHGLVLVLFVQLDIVQREAPGLIADESAVAATTARLVDQGMALVEAERARRKQANAADNLVTAAVSGSRA